MTDNSLTWHHLRLTTADEPGIVALHDADDGRDLGTLSFVLDASWTPAASLISDDEFEWTWTRRASSTQSQSPGEAWARVRMSTGPGLSWRLAMGAEGPEFRIAPPTLRWLPNAPTRNWLGGTNALLVLDDRPGDGQVTAAKLVHGLAREHRPAADESGVSIDLGPEHIGLSTQHGYSTSWVVERFASMVAATSALPSWVPTDVTPDSGRPIFIDLPDAAVTVQPSDKGPEKGSDKGDAHVITDERGSQVTATGGSHHIGVFGPGLESELLITWKHGLDDMLCDAAETIMSHVDPRSAEGFEAALVDHADTAHLLAHDAAAEFLDSYCRERLDAPASQRCAPEATPALLHWAFGDGDRMANVLDRLAPAAKGPGAMLAWLSASLAARAHGLSFDHRLPIDPGNPLCRGMLAILTGGIASPAPADAANPEPANPEPGAVPVGALPSALWEAAAWLHGPLPGRLPSNDMLATAQACAILALCPARWDSAPRLGLQLAHEIENTRAWVAAGNPDHRTLSWLVWQ